MYGTQTYDVIESVQAEFENDVKMYGTQTFTGSTKTHRSFENDVKMYGTQTYVFYRAMIDCLRMM